MCFTEFSLVLDLKRRRSVTFVEAQTGPCELISSLASDHSQILNAKTSEFAFFNKLKSSFGLSSSEASNPKDIESRGQIHNGLGFMISSL